ncbi:alkaline phosphatase family protein [Mesorhizobium sp.]|uniref:alkaline phosphatase family protein n=1 Tax=Mesorhizobium sp. TaxID=1871066 RepID=UPI000FE4C0AC|nr:alkaline phosphatase family protein [Mesorhizobium sp.]RWA81308.1 MAG: acid phosphatase [Mesorhizobium sp.]
MRKQNGRTLLRRLPIFFLIIGSSLVGTPLATASSKRPPKYDHVVMVIMENHSFKSISQARAATYLNRLAKGGALFTHSFGVTHPSQPNYLALFSGSTHGITDDGWHQVAAPNLATSLSAADKTFLGYVEAGSPRKHNPWESFANGMKFEAPLNELPRDYTKLPSVSFVIPNLKNDMHNGTIKQADRWLKSHLAGYARWAMSNNSLLIVTFDEDDYDAKNRIFTVFYGFGVEPGLYSERIDHYTILRTIEDIASVPLLGKSAARKVIRSSWK